MYWSFHWSILCKVIWDNFPRTAMLFFFAIFSYIFFLIDIFFSLEMISVMNILIQHVGRKTVMQTDVIYQLLLLFYQSEREISVFFLFGARCFGSKCLSTCNVVSKSNHIRSNDIETLATIWFYCHIRNTERWLQNSSTFRETLID